MDHLIPVDIQVFRTATRDINFDIFLRLSDDNVAHVFSRTTGIDYKRLAQYIQKGVSHLYIRKADEDIYKAFIARPAHIVFNDPNSSQEKKIASLLNMTEQNMAEVFSQVHIEEETAGNTVQLVNSYVNMVTQSPQILAIILKLVSHGEYLYYHAIAVAIFSMFIAKATGQVNQRTLELVGLGGFFHDIGYTQLPRELVYSNGELSAEDWRRVRAHPKLGLNMLEHNKTIPDEVRYIVYQHHEEPGGQGYPNGLHSPVIYYPAKIVALADGFSALISKRPFRKAYSVEEAIRIIQEQPGKYDRELVKVMAQVFLPRLGGVKAA